MPVVIKSGHMCRSCDLTPGQIDNLTYIQDILKTISCLLNPVTLYFFKTSFCHRSLSTLLFHGNPIDLPCVLILGDFKFYYKDCFWEDFTNVFDGGVFRGCINNERSVGYK